MLVVVSNRGRMPNHNFSDTELHFRVRNILRASIQNIFALIAHFSTGDVASTNGTGIRCSRAWIRMYVARHLEEHE